MKKISLFLFRPFNHLLIRSFVRLQFFFQIKQIYIIIICNFFLAFILSISLYFQKQTRTLLLIFVVEIIKKKEKIMTQISLFNLPSVFFLYFILRSTKFFYLPEYSPLIIVIRMSIIIYLDDGWNHSFN